MSNVSDILEYEYLGLYIILILKDYIFGLKWLQQFGSDFF